MLEYDRIDASKGTDVKKNPNSSRDCMICHYWYFLKINCRLQPKLCNGCDDLKQKGYDF